VRFLLPSDYFNSKKVDEAYLEQVACLQDMGFEISVVSLETLRLEISRIFPMPEPQSKVIHRGWMITPADYALLVSAVTNAGADILISQDEYLLTHYLPNWYPLISDLTPKTQFCSIDDDLEQALMKIAWSSFFIKD